MSSAIDRRVNVDRSSSRLLTDLLASSTALNKIDLLDLVSDPLECLVRPRRDDDSSSSELVDERRRRRDDDDGGDDDVTVDDAGGGDLSSFRFMTAPIHECIGLVINGVVLEDTYLAPILDERLLVVVVVVVV